MVSSLCHFTDQSVHHIVNFNLFLSEVLLASSLIENKHISIVGFNKAMRHSNPSHPLSGNASTQPLEKGEGVGDFSNPPGMSLIAISFSLIH